MLWRDMLGGRTIHGAAARLGALLVRLGKKTKKTRDYKGLNTGGWTIRTQEQAQQLTACISKPELIQEQPQHPSEARAGI